MTKDPTTEFAPGAGQPHVAAHAADGKRWLGHPIGLSTLFFTELWERFSYYGMRGILILYMVATFADGGLEYGTAKAAAIYGMYTGFVYLLALPGGWVADNLWGQRKAVFVGGCVIAAGHFTMALPMLGLPEQPLFFSGLILIVIGTGLLKPNVSTIVGELYPEGGARRDAGFSVFYTGINLGAFLGPLICGWLGENVNWHWGFSAAGFGMVLGLIQYKLGERNLGNAGLLASGDAADVTARKARSFYFGTAVAAGLAVLFIFLATSGVLALSLQQVATWLGYMILLLVILFFAYLIMGVAWAAGFAVLFGVAVVFFQGMTEGDLAGQYAIAVTLGIFIFANIVLLGIRRGVITMEKRRLMVIFWIFLLAALFWSGFEQAGSSLNIFADENTDREIFGWLMPASWLQSINPLFIITLAPVFGAMWIALAKRNANPSIPVKFALGLLGLAAGFFVISWGAANSQGELASPVWLIVTYFLHTCGELCLSPVGLSSITKLAPRDRVGQMMGIWFIAAALGNLIAGLLAGQLENLENQALFSQVAMIIGICGLIALLLSPLVRKLMGDVE